MRRRDRCINPRHGRHPRGAAVFDPFIRFPIQLPRAGPDRTHGCIERTSSAVEVDAENYRYALLTRCSMIAGMSVPESPYTKTAGVVQQKARMYDNATRFSSKNSAKRSVAKHHHHAKTIISYICSDAISKFFSIRYIGGHLPPRFQMCLTNRKHLASCKDEWATFGYQIVDGDTVNIPVHLAGRYWYCHDISTSSYT